MQKRRRRGRGLQGNREAAGRPRGGGAAARPERHGVARWISKLGVLSRSEAERRVREGRVAVNGRAVRDPDHPCHPERDAIAIDGRPLRAARRVYLAMHKPAGTITTARDPEGRPTVYDLLPPGAGRAQAVGRLDADTTGLLLFTNDTAFADAVTDGSGGIEKVYIARLRGRVSPGTARRFESGVEIDGSPTLPARCRILERGDDWTRIEAAIREGRNRQIRRMWEILGHEVLELHRVQIGPILLGGLPPGKTRPLSEYERAALLAQYRGPRPDR